MASESQRKLGVRYLQFHIKSVVFKLQDSSTDISKNKTEKQQHLTLFMAISDQKK